MTSQQKSSHVSKYPPTADGAAQMALDRWTFHRARRQQLDDELDQAIEMGRELAYGEMVRLLTGRHPAPSPQWVQDHVCARRDQLAREASREKAQQVRTALGL